MMLGSDLSFTPQEVAAGAVFTDHGVRREPGQDHGRQRRQLGQDPAVGEPAAGYSDLADDLAFAKTLRATA